MTEAAPRQSAHQTKKAQPVDPSSGLPSQSFKVAIVIVSWNTRKLLTDCLLSVKSDLSRNRIQGEIWVVDNASTDGTVAMLQRDFPDVTLIASEDNLGFAAANNVALRTMGFVDLDWEAAALSGEGQAPFETTGSDLPAAVLLLNPDTIVHPGAIRALIECLQSTPAAGVVGGRLVYGDGSFQHSAFAFPGLWQLAIELLPVPGRLAESSLNGRYAGDLYTGGQPFQIGHPLGAVMCVRREAIQQAGLLDERFHMYVEEVDWTRRIRARGWKAYCVPGAVFTHYGGQSTGQVRLRSFVDLWASRHRYYRKHHQAGKVWLARQIVRLGMKRKARIDRNAVRQGELSAKERSERLSAYDQVNHFWRN
jgi:GT2 family glycosyltransferase